MVNQLRGITSPDLTRVIRAALQGGWEWVGHTGTTHAQIQWPPTGEKITFGLTPSVGSWKTTATEIKRISGVEVWAKGNRRRSRKATRPSGFNLYSNSHSQDQWRDRLEELHGDLHRYIVEFEDIVEGRTSRSDVGRAKWLLREIRRIEDELEVHHQPVKRFQPVA